ncbi:secernin-3 [Cylas formicarius]|uniref:secernin-3 n=1 Tax=Cylas formicarius TaxID=197179 RepID=UPI002958B29C|nr:secernin-3 [Cylas formicarius]
MDMEIPQSCDTFVVLPPLTKHGVVFGKNSDRPQNEIQEVVFYPASESSTSTKCTYIEIDAVKETKAVILSKPNWMWGAEMGANECGVAVGNEAIWTNDNDGEHDPHVKRLLGMDLVRLALERSSTADEALEIITKLLEKYGQGGPCSSTDLHFTYHNSFLIADPNGAWVLETSGKHWAAEKITSGYRNISNVLSITTKIDKKSDGLEEYAKLKSLWNGEGEFNFCEVFSGEKKPGDARYLAGKELLRKYTSLNTFRETDMFKVLRDKDSGICRTCENDFPTQGSQVSTLSSDRPSIHWFTATPDPSISVFKPFIFTKNAIISKHTVCPDNTSPHILYALHLKANTESNQVQELLQNMETNCVRELDQVIENVGEDLSEFDELLKDCVETEVKFYR